jgi:beta-glucanase (GH16 family)
VLASRRLVVLLTTLLAGAVVVSVAGAARTNGFHDEFTSFEVKRWVKVSRPFGHGAVDAANVGVSSGSLAVRLPGGKLDGGEMRSADLYRYGSFRARIKVADAPSSVTAFFLYKKPDYAQEIDIEIFNDSTRRIWFSTYAGGGQTNTVEKLLPFDASADFHEYAIEYDPGLVRFLADGVELQRWSSGITRSSMYLYVNAWFPSWLGGVRPLSDRFTYVDWIDYSPR